jgi:hypothetical protein
VFKCVNDNNLLDENKYHKENTEALLHTSKEIGLEVYAEKTKYAYKHIHVM